MFLTEISAVLCISSFFLISYLVGFSVLSLLKIELKYPFSVNLPIYSGVGLAVLSLVLSVIGIELISSYVLMAVILLSLSVCLACILLRKKPGFPTIKNFHLSMGNLVPFMFLLFLIFSFGSVLARYEFPPFGDAINHSLITNLMVQNHQISLNYLPISTAPLDNPFGFHVISASFSLLTGLFPAQSVFALAISITVMVPLIFYSLTYVLSKSILVSTSVVLSTFLINPPPLNLESYFVGYLYNGPYPNLFGYLGLCLLALFIAIGEKQERFHLGIFGLLIAFLTVTYPPFVVFPVIFAVVKLRRLVKAPFKTTSRKILFLALVGGAVLASIGFFSNPSFSSAVISKLELLLQSVGYKISLPFFINTAGISVILGVLVASFFMFKRMNSNVSLFFLSVALPCFVSLLAYVFPILGFTNIILPRRSIVFASMLSWVLIFLLVFSTGWQSIETDIKVLRRKFKLTYYSSSVVCVLLASIIFAPSVFALFSPQNNMGWFGLKTEDSEIFDWIEHNVSPKDLIMNDFSYASLFLPSFTIRNVTCRIFINTDNELNRAADVQSFFTNPSNLNLFRNLVEKYNISYVLFTSEPGYKDWYSFGGTNAYVPYQSQAQRIESFNNNPYLTSVSKIGSDVVYRVNASMPNLERTSLNVSDVNFWEVIKGSNSFSLNTTNASLEINTRESINVVDFRHFFIAPQNWSKQEFVGFSWKGNNTGTSVQLYLRGPTDGDYERYDFVDSWSGWYSVILPLKTPVAEYGSPSLGNVTEIQFVMQNTSVGTWGVSDFCLLAPKNS